MDIRNLFYLSSGGWLMKLIAAIAIILIGLIASRIISRIVKKVLHELEVNRILNDQAGIKIPVEEFLSSLTKYIIYLITLIWALAELGLQTTILYIILTIILVVLVSFIVLAFKDFIPNLTAGFFLHQKGKIKPGDVITIKDITGEIVTIGPVETVIRANKDLVYMPNSVLMKNEIIKKVSKPKKR